LKINHANLLLVICIFYLSLSAGCAPAGKNMLDPLPFHIAGSADENAGEDGAEDYIPELSATALIGFHSSHKIDDLAPGTAGLRVRVPIAERNWNIECGYWVLHSTNEPGEMAIGFDNMITLKKQERCEGFAGSFGLGCEFQTAAWFRPFFRASLDYIDFDYDEDYSPAPIARNEFHAELHSLGLEGGAGVRFLIADFTIEIGIDYAYYFNNLKLQHGFFINSYSYLECKDFLDKTEIGPTRVYFGLGMQF